MNDELEIKEWVLTTIMSCTTQDYYETKVNLLEERDIIRKEMFKRLKQIE
jgi:hypothetical protein